MPTYIKNKKAYNDYEIIETYEAGMKLLGHEVKSIREGHGNLKGSYVKIIKDEVWLVGFNLPPYSKSNVLFDYDPLRPRKLLLNRKEINKLIGKVSKQGYTLVPLEIYTSRNLLKLKIALAKGKKKKEKKETLIKKQQEKEIQREIKEFNNFG